ncbi:MAG TPA: ATP-binding protein [Acidobacteriota bacterium]|nr:ATP-binding protein [Acidobacteriota bacterium]
MELVPVFGYLIGTAVHTLIAALVTVRKQKRPSERIFLFLVLAVLVWHGGNLLALILGRIFGEQWSIAVQFFRSVALLGLGALPALLVHTHVAFLRESQGAIPTRHQNSLLAVIYAPLLWFVIPLSKVLANPAVSPFDILSEYMLPYVCWFVTSLIISAVIDLRLARVQEDEPFRHFYRVIGTIFFFIAILTTFTYILGGREFPWLRKYLEVISIISSILPSTILAYFIYRYNFLELVIRRSFFVITLSFVIFGAYFLGVRQITLYLAKYFDIIPGLFEALSILALVVTFPIYKKWLQKRVNQFFFREFGYYHQLFSELEQTINRIFGLQPLVDYIQKTTSKVLFLDSINLTIFETEENRIKFLATTHETLPQIEQIVKKIQDENARLLRMEDVKEEEVITEMKNIGATLILPIRHKERLMGIFSFKARPPRRPILTQELEMLRSLVAQTAMSVASALLMEDKLKLEREMAKKERMASIGQMAATLAHEIKNPLSSIKSITQSLQEQSPDQSLKQDLEVIVNEVDRLNYSVNQLLQFARSSSQDMTDLSVVEVMERVIKILQNETRNQNVLINHNYNGNIPSVFASSFALQDVFLNLLLNALQAMPSGGEIQIDYQKNGKSLEINISDSGPGIRPEMLTRIFDPFFTTKQKGTGLGLAVVKQKLSEFGADINVSNLKPTGSRFTITFPVG